MSSETRKKNDPVEGNEATEEEEEDEYGGSTDDEGATPTPDAVAPSHGIHLKLFFFLFCTYLQMKTIMEL